MCKYCEEKEYWNEVEKKLNRRIKGKVWLCDSLYYEDKIEVHFLLDMPRYTIRFLIPAKTKNKNIKTIIDQILNELQEILMQNFVLK